MTATATDAPQMIADGGWSDAMVADLKSLLAEGCSFGQIAKILSARYRTITRSAAIGKATRLKLSGRGSGASIQRKPKQRASSASRKQCSKNAKLSPRRTPRPKIADTLEKAQVDLLAEPDPISVAERHAILRKNERGDIEVDPNLTEKSCRWPIGDPSSPDFYFCCREKVSGTSYCLVHARRAFVPLTPKKRRASRSVHELDERETNERGMVKTVA